jgi:hypothetical protein
MPPVCQVFRTVQLVFRPTQGSPSGREQAAGQLVFVTPAVDAWLLDFTRHDASNPSST